MGGAAEPLLRVRRRKQPHLDHPGGPSGTPAPLANFTPLSFQGFPLVNTSLPPGAVITFLMFFADEANAVSYDLITAVVQP